MLTAKNEVENKEAGLDTGADDYLAKPFDLKELSARVRALLRRPHEYQEETLTTSQLTLEPQRKKAILSGREIQLNGLEFALLEFFMRHPGQVFGPQALLERVWMTDSTASIGTVRTYIKTLRQELQSGREVSMIQTVHGSGYRFDPPAS